MTEVICDLLEEPAGVINAYSWPTGMENDGPEEYIIFFDKTDIEFSSVEQLLTDAVEQNREGGVYITTSGQPSRWTNRPGEHFDSANDSVPALLARVFVHPAANALRTLQQDIEGVTDWSLNWEPHVGHVGNTWVDTRYLITHPASGTLSLIFNTVDDTQCGAVVDLVRNTLAGVRGVERQFSVHVSKTDSDECCLQITTR